MSCNGLYHWLTIKSQFHEDLKPLVGLERRQSPESYNDHIFLYQVKLRNKTETNIFTVFSCN